VRLAYDEPQVGEEEVQAELERLRRSAGQLVTVEDAEDGLKEGQYAILDFEGYTDGEPIEGGKAQEYVLEIGSRSFIEGFEEQLVGMHPGDQRHITVTFPDDYGVEELAGKEVEFDVKLLEIKEHRLPELDSEFLEELGSYESVDELTEDILKRLQSEASRKAERDYRNDVISEVIERAELVVPEVLVNRRIEELINDLREQFRRQNFSLEDYLQQTGQSMEELREEFRERAQGDVKADLVLEAVAEAEGIEADPEDLEAEVEAMARLYGQPADAFRSMMLGGQNAGQLRYNIKVQKTIGYLTELAQGTDPTEAREEAARKYRERLQGVRGQAPVPEEPSDMQEGDERAEDVFRFDG